MSKKGKSKDKSNFYTTEKIGKTRELTPEGYLLCRDVAIARTGELTYADGEIPVNAKNGIITVSRSADDLFKPETMMSFEGKVVTNDHPEDWVTPENWKEHAVGNCFNVHRGTGIEDDLLYADLLITDRQAINDVQQEGKIEISLGYDADYEQTAPGRGIQRNIIGNHVALVDRGRCGTRCAIGDSKTMSTKTKTKAGVQSKKLSFADRIRKLIKTGDAEEAEKLAQAAEDSELEVETGDGEDDPDEENNPTPTGDGATILAAIRAMDAKNDKRFKALEKRFKDAESDPEADPDKTKDDDDNPDDDKTKDDILGAEPAQKKDDSGEITYTGDSLQNVVSRAEILSPGIRLPTLDAKTKDVGQQVRQCKVSALTKAYGTEDGKKAIDPFIAGNSDFAKLPAVTLDAAFIGASELIRQQNNSQGMRSGIGTKDFGNKPRTPAEINAANRKYWQDRASK